MIKDRVFKRLLIPLLGILIPLSAGLITFEHYSIFQLVLSNIFFVFTSFLIWEGNVKIISVLRYTQLLQKNIFLKLLTLSVATALYSMIVIVLHSLLWQWVVLGTFVPPPVVRSAVICAVTVVVLTLVYESIFLNTERELDNRILEQLDQERIQAEVQVLKNELDPHFLFNCLNTLTHLVQHDPARSVQFISKLSKVYKYFLLNKEKDLVPLEEELDFLHNYYYLLRIRFDDHVQIETRIDAWQKQWLILPCALQILVENAIKHNFFSDKVPLVITITANEGFVVVTNAVKPKLHAVDSTHTGLKNLVTRCRLMLNKPVIIQSTQTKFLVKLPIVKEKMVS